MIKRPRFFSSPRTLGNWTFRVLLLSSLVVLYFCLSFIFPFPSPSLSLTFPTGSNSVSSAYNQQLENLRKVFYYTMDRQLAGIRDVALVHLPCTADSENFLSILGQRQYLKERNISVRFESCSSKFKQSVANATFPKLHPMYAAVLHAAPIKSSPFNLQDVVTSSQPSLNSIRQFKLRSFPVNYPFFVDDNMQRALHAMRGRGHPDAYLTSSRITEDTRYARSGAGTFTFAPDSSITYLNQLNHFYQPKGSKNKVNLILSRDHNVPIAGSRAIKYPWAINFWGPEQDRKILNVNTTLVEQATQMLDYAQLLVSESPYFITDKFQLHLLATYANLKHVYIINDYESEFGKYELDWLQGLHSKGNIAVAKDLYSAMLVVKDWLGDN
ncbi:Golgi 4,6-pyruvylated galactose (PvGal) biosynthesis protein Pvg5 [Schizosaccharomyces osmophilus]|uniref:Golgi 4,6-pyruvylated galactose (PvGal) biosynthesis protein Pvg5 n=1 Tax=Schizosaccharomyces osmophilus TaxID=2545709 RepID=A0AAE9WDY8_9SCHI|nr:Golgi 4,6-pyruvylated galactose (PvGal) biosynthesis protein Pvg5 [Schizosaccharomyces osmophilus]WBW74504.1 Golgi 4,6-pyruvylated galactose (PvGal) biosynthesis protein Pvg5 [Schizosaccharomyces osmophilus]